LTLIAILAAIAIPRFDWSIMESSSVVAAAREISGDLRLCRDRAISEAGTNPEGYAIRMSGKGSSYAAYEIVNLATSETVSTKNLHSAVTCTGDVEFHFGPLGNLVAGSGSTLQLSGGGKQTVLRVIPATGAVMIEEQ
jgi:Tfp pilus assembly protein FimT